MLQKSRRWMPTIGLISLLVCHASVVGRGQFASFEPMGGGMSAQQERKAAVAPRVYFETPMTPAAADTHALLSKAIDFPFRNETPLEDVIQYISESSTDDAHPHGVPIYLNPVGLLRQDRTPQSPVSISLYATPISRGLELALAQLDMTYYVGSDGLVIITSPDEKDQVTVNPMPLLLDEVRAMREEMAELRTRLDIEERK
jgi:hypothetical protein